MNNSPRLMELFAREVAANPSLFLNPVTGTTWEVGIKDGRLLVNVPNFSFQIFPSSTTRYRPVNTQVNLEIEFEGQGQKGPRFMHVYAFGIRRATFSQLEREG